LPVDVVLGAQLGPEVRECLVPLDRPVRPGDRHEGVVDGALRVRSASMASMIDFVWPVPADR